MDTATGRIGRYWALLTKYTAPQTAKVAVLAEGRVVAQGTLPKLLGASEGMRQL